MRFLRRVRERSGRDEIPAPRIRSPRSRVAGGLTAAVAIVLAALSPRVDAQGVPLPELLSRSIEEPRSGSGPSRFPSVDPFGTVIAFESAAPDLGTEDKDTIPDIYLLERLRGRLTAISNVVARVVKKGPSAGASINDPVRSNGVIRCVFTSVSTNLDFDQLILEFWKDGVPSAGWVCRF